ncbi:hypothetical protein [Synechococcus sp. BS55D]|uniref:hypothetical protein n=1 Tax=Synechococcus sp. BS55D TaxID=2055943 RepID=UPI001F1C1105|nr:hypothetical protein [Synechococcus sp. BS55D]
MQSRLHGELAGAGQPVARGVVARRDREADLVVQLGRRRDVAFLLDVESHAGGPDRNAATIRSDRLGDNCCGGLCPYASFGFSPYFRRLVSGRGRSGAPALLVVSGRLMARGWL